jgi:hypothetical protein
MASAIDAASGTFAFLRLAAVALAPFLTMLAAMPETRGNEQDKRPARGEQHEGNDTDPG